MRAVLAARAIRVRAPLAGPCNPRVRASLGGPCNTGVGLDLQARAILRARTSPAGPCNYGDGAVAALPLQPVHSERRPSSPFSCSASRAITGAGFTCRPRAIRVRSTCRHVQLRVRRPLLGARAIIDRDVKIEHARIAHSERLYGCGLYLEPVQYGCGLYLEPAQ